MIRKTITNGVGVLLFVASTSFIIETVKNDVEVDKPVIYAQALQAPTPTVTPILPTLIIPNSTIKPKEEKEEFDKEKVIQAINKALDVLDSRMKNKGEVIYKAGKKYKVNSMMMAAIMQQEIGVKPSDPEDPLIRCNNVAGINRRTGRAYSGRYAVYKSIDESIYDMALLLRENYLNDGLKDIPSIGNRYCPVKDKDNGKFGMVNESWIPNVEEFYKQILADAESEAK